MGKRTKDQWRADGHDVFGPGEKWIATFHGKDGRKNAITAAAAPGLLSALRALTDPEGHIFHGTTGGECTGECKAVRAAIAKAEGRDE